MKPRLIPIFAALTLALWGAAAAALDPREADILGLRLGMAVLEVESRLQAQGSSEARWISKQQPCDSNRSGLCLTALTAPTKDGLLDIAFSPAETIVRIDYTLRSMGMGEPAIIRSAVLSQFGPPSDATELAWCLRPNAAGACSLDRPSLRLLPGPGVTSVLRLSEGEKH